MTFELLEFAREKKIIISLISLKLKEQNEFDHSKNFTHTHKEILIKILTKADRFTFF